MGGRTVLWLGGMSGVGKTTAARVVARRHDLWLYSLDSRTFAHAERLPEDSRTLDELWVERSPERMADEFEEQARRRFSLVLDDLAELPADGAPLLAEGPQFLPSLVDGPALFVVASPLLQHELVTARGSLTYSATSDPERVLANRLRRDELLGRRLGGAAVAISAVEETEPLVESFVREHAPDWIAAADPGDVAARRRDDNERRLDQWRRYAAHEPRAAEGTVELACECDRAGCVEIVARTLAGASRRPRLAH